MLKVCVEYNDNIAARVIEACREGYLLAEVPTEIDDSDRRIGRLDCMQQREGIVAAAVINEMTSLCSESSCRTTVNRRLNSRITSSSL
jgi:hypothetical protein